MRHISKILYSIKQGIRGVFHKIGMSFVSVLSITSSLIILGVVITIVLNINNFIDTTSDEINEMNVTMESDLGSDGIKELERRLSEVKGVKSVTFKGKDASFKAMRDSWGEDAYLLDGVENPLEDYYLVVIDDSSDISTISKTIKKIDGVSDVEYYEDIISNFLTVSKLITKFGLLMIMGLLLICLVIISNTIKSRVYHKQEEIKIVKYIGASNLFVVSPFIIEGFIIGLIGSAIAICSCNSMYGYIVSNIGDNVSIAGMTLLSLNSVSAVIVWSLLLTGVTVGVLGSIVSVKRYLKV